MWCISYSLITCSDFIQETVQTIWRNYSSIVDDFVSSKNALPDTHRELKSAIYIYIYRSRPNRGSQALCRSSGPLPSPHGTLARVERWHIGTLEVATVGQWPRDGDFYSRCDWSLLSMDVIVFDWMIDRAGAEPCRPTIRSRLSACSVDRQWHEVQYHLRIP